MIMNQKNILHVINFGSFPGKALFTCGFTFKEICKELKKQKCKDWLDAFISTKDNFEPDIKGFASLKTLIIEGKEYYYSFLHLRDGFDFSDDHHIVLAHEVIHLCTYNLKYCFDITKENEAFAYTHSHIMKQCYEIIRLNRIDK